MCCEVYDKKTVAASRWGVVVGSPRRESATDSAIRNLS
jgi:hypothetical protein